MPGHRNADSNRTAWETDPRNANAVHAGIARRPDPVTQEGEEGGERDTPDRFVIPLPSARARVRGTRREMKREMRHLAHADTLALLDPELPVSVKDRLTAATLALKVSGDLRDRVDVTVRHVLPAVSFLSAATLRPVLDVPAAAGGATKPGARGEDGAANPPGDSPAPFLPSGDSRSPFAPPAD